MDIENVNEKELDFVAMSLVTIGALNWGLVGLLSLDLVGTVFGKRSLLSRLVYTMVGASGAYMLMTMLGKRAEVVKMINECCASKKHAA